jgi:hypothetical protein
MSMLDPFNPRPDPLSGPEPRARRAAGEPGSTKTFLWVPAVIVGGIGIIAVIAAL